MPLAVSLPDLVLVDRMRVVEVDDASLQPFVNHVHPSEGHPPDRSATRERRQAGSDDADDDDGEAADDE